MLLPILILTAERILDYFEGEAVDCYGTTLLLTIDKPERVFQCNSLRLLTISSQINKVSEYITFQWKYCLRHLLCITKNERTIFVYSYFEKGCRKKCTFYWSQLFAESTIRLKTANLLCTYILSYSTWPHKGLYMILSICFNQFSGVYLLSFKCFCCNKDCQIPKRVSWWCRWILILLLI